tara:strand:- start:763 stop:996 length:234 start_codon:yes stop_codon:yes gene_type:complete
MKTMAEHLDLINNSTYHQNITRGLVIDKSRYSMQQKQQDQFSKSKKLNSKVPMFDNKTRNMGNFQADQLEQIGYTYG